MKENSTNIKNHIFIPIADRVLYEDNHIIIVNKLASEIVQGDKTGDKTLADDIKKYLKHKYNKPGEVFLGVVHRLDRPVSGAIIFARTSKALTRLNKLIHDREIHKFYWAIVANKPLQNNMVLINYLRKNEKENKSYVFDTQVPDSYKAELKFELVKTSDKYYLLEIELMTGRHHQIRAQLANIDCPIRGDLKYGYKRSNPDASISLHARKISFIHPIKNEPIEVLAPLPDNSLWRIFNKFLKL